MYTHSYSFNTDICLHINSAECTVRLLNQAGRNNYPCNREILFREQTKAHDQTFVGVPDSGCPPVPAGQLRPYLVNFAKSP